MRRLLLALALAAGATPALAALPPQYYERARDDAPNVVVFDVLEVAPPAQDPGDCRVTGRIIRSERGDLYKPGDEMTVLVPCHSPAAAVPSGGAVWQDLDALTRSAHGKAWLDDAGALVLDQYELYDLH